MTKIFTNKRGIPQTILKIDPRLESDTIEVFINSEKAMEIMKITERGIAVVIFTMVKVVVVEVLINMIFITSLVDMLRKDIIEIHIDLIREIDILKGVDLTGQVMKAIRIKNIHV